MTERRPRNNDPRLERLKGDLAAMAALVERNVDTAVMALVDGNARLAYEVITLDTDIDEMEIVLDRACLDLLCREHTAREDFRFLTAAMKINNDLERISNQAVTIAEHVPLLARLPGGEAAVLPDLGEMLELVEDMLRESVEALLRRDGDMAWKVWDRHVAVGDHLRRVLEELAADAARAPQRASRAICLVRAGVALGQVGEYAKDIAEEVIYMREGIIVKHHEREYRARGRKQVESAAGTG